MPIVRETKLCDSRGNCNEPRVIDKVSCSGPTSLAIRWIDGQSVLVELAGWIASDSTLAALKDRRFFAAARVEGSGAHVTWGSLGIAASHLSRISDDQCAFNRHDLILWQSELRLSNQESADFLGISLSAWNAYKAGTNPVPALVAMVCRAALRDPILRHARYKPRTRGRPRKVVDTQVAVGDLELCAELIRRADRA